jgi:hypothetical protein
MRAPDINNAARWDDIKRVLKRVRLDADSMQIKGRSLRVELDRLAAQCTERRGSKILTTRQLQCSRDEALDKIARFRDVIAPRGVPTFFAGDAVAAELRAALDNFESALQSADVGSEGRDAPEIVEDAAGMRLQSGGGNASKEAQNQYWRRLARLWRFIAPNTPRPRLIDFLCACTGAKPSAVRAFLDRREP